MVDFTRGTMPLLAARLLETTPIHTGEWQSTDTSGIPQRATYELMDVTFRTPVFGELQWAPLLGEDLNLPWAEEHFLERVGGMPVNPPPSHVRWPWARHNGNHQTEEKFSHSYPERMWPKYAGLGNAPVPPVFEGNHHHGIRFAYGDLRDVVDLLIRSPYTRQAYLPIWFPEDTGAHHRQRVPCTLGYHFMIRGGNLSCRYYIRSCDLIRHFTDDVYMAGRLMHWVCNEVNKGICQYYADPKAVCEHEHFMPGELVMHIASLHAFTGDDFKLKEIMRRSHAQSDR